jgi:hypothetical protein
LALAIGLFALASVWTVKRSQRTRTTKKSVRGRAVRTVQARWTGGKFACRVGQAREQRQCHVDAGLPAVWLFGTDAGSKDQPCRCAGQCHPPLRVTPSGMLGLKDRKL